MVLAEIERILITGSRGWIGSRVCKVLKEQGMNVATIAHDMPTHEIVAASRAAKVVVHAGASPFVDRHTVFETGLDQAMAVARGVCEVDNSVILLSSTKVYGLAGIEDKTVTEDAKPDPDCAYGRAKLAAEEMLAATSSRCRILRISNVVGPHIPSHFLLGALLENARSSGELTFTCDGNSRRDYVDLSNVVNTIVGCVNLAWNGHQPEGVGAVNVVSGELVSFLDLADLFKAELGVGSKFLGNSPTLVPKFSTKKSRQLGFSTNTGAPISMIRDCLVHEWNRLGT